MLYTLCNFIISNTDIFHTVPFRIFMLRHIVPFMLCVIIPFMLCQIVPFNSLSHRASLLFLILQCDIHSFLCCVIFYLYMLCYITLLCCAIYIVPFHIVLHCTFYTVSYMLYLFYVVLHHIFKCFVISYFYAASFKYDIPFYTA